MFNFKPKAYHQFIADYPLFNKTAILDKLRATEYKRLDKNKHVYLDYTGGNLYAESQLDKHMELLKKQTFGNPHSTNPTSQESTRLCEATRNHVLHYFNASEDYYCVFTANASAALKLVGESYPFSDDAFLLLSLDNHNSVNGMREFAKNKGAGFKYSELDSVSLRLNEGELMNNLDSHSDKGNRLFAFPAQSNVSGIKHPLKYVELAQSKGWDVLLDAAAFVPSNRLDLKKVRPDFVTISFYKIFGYPTGLGCLLIRKDKFPKLIKPWYAGGTVSVAAAKYQGRFLLKNHERFEEGTTNYLGIPAIKIGLEHIEKIGIDIIHTRVQILGTWLLKHLDELKHENGNKLIQIYGSHDMEERGGTLVMNFFDQKGELYPFMDIEKKANEQLISIRTGCFCNPGVDETTNEITESELGNYFANRTDGNFNDLIEYTGKLRGSIRVSVGLVSNFNDVLTFVNFSKSFLNKDR